jgi:hypothetical protein
MNITREWLERKLAELDAAGVDESAECRPQRTLNSIRAKMQVGYIPENNSDTVNVSASVVYSDDPKSENKAFSDSTPSGSLTLYIQKAKLASRFLEQGDIIYVDISIADKNPWNYLSNLPVHGAKIVCVDDWENVTVTSDILTIRTNKKSDNRPTYADALDTEGNVVVSTYPQVKDCPYKYWRYVTK